MKKDDFEAECERYTRLLSKRAIDIVCMGIGENGHIAFNDPHVADFNDKDWMKVVDLAPNVENNRCTTDVFNLLMKFHTGIHAHYPDPDVCRIYILYRSSLHKGRGCLQYLICSSMRKVSLYDSCAKKKTPGYIWIWTALRFYL